MFSSLLRERAMQREGNSASAFEVVDPTRHSVFCTLRALQKTFEKPYSIIATGNGS